MGNDAVGRQTRQSRVRDQEGLSLIESLIALVVTASAVLTMLVALQVILVLTDSNRRTVRSGIELTSLAEAVRGLQYMDCEGSAALDARLTGVVPPVYTPPPGFSVQVVEVRYLDSEATSSPDFLPTCPTPDRGVQRVTFRIQSTGGPEIADEIVVHTRRDTCPATVGAAPGQRC